MTAENRNDRRNSFAPWDDTRAPVARKDHADVIKRVRVLSMS
jgi:hypothetical protein